MNLVGERNAAVRLQRSARSLLATQARRGPELHRRGSDAVYASHLGYWATNGKHWLNPQSTHSMRTTNQPATSFEGMSEMEVLAISRRRRQAKLTLSAGIG